MAYLLSLGDVTHRWGQSRYRERGIPETLSGIPSSVARVLLSQHTRYEHIMKSIQALESEHEIKKEHRYERVLRSLAGRKKIHHALKKASEILLQSAHKNCLEELGLLPEERPVIAQLLVAAEGNPENAFKNRDILSVNDHAVLCNLFRRLAIQYLQECESSRTFSPKKCDAA